MHGSVRYPQLQGRDTLGVSFPIETGRAYNGIQVRVFEDTICGGECTRDFRQSAKAELLGAPLMGDWGFSLIEDNAVYLGGEHDQRYGIWHVRYNAVHRRAEKEVFAAVGDSRGTRPGMVTYTTTRWGHLVDPKKTPPGERTPNGSDCIRFSLSDSRVDVAMSGPDNEEHMKQALAALELGPMNDEELAWMRRVGDHIYGRDATTSLRD